MNRRSILRIVPCTCVLLVFGAGCDSGAFSFGGGNRTIFYRLGSVERSLHWDPDPSGQSRETRQMIKALQLYDAGEVATARQVGETLLESDCDATATELLAVIDTRFGHDCQATCRLEESIKRHPEHAGLRKTLAWNLCRLHEHDRALLVATKAAEEIDDVELWDVVAAVRQDRQEWYVTLEKQTLWFKSKRLMKIVFWFLVIGGICASFNAKS